MSEPATCTGKSLLEQVQIGISKRSDFTLVKSKAALLIIDVQHHCCTETTEYYAKTAKPRMITNVKRLVKSFRHYRDMENASGNVSSKGGCEVIFVAIQSLTNDRRDISLDYKLSGPFFMKLPNVSATDDEIFLPSLRPITNQGKGDIVIRKTSSSVFQSTNIDYVLRNLGVEQLIVCGQLTDQCVESSVRSAADLGYFLTVVEDACAAHSLEEHDRGLLGMKGYCRIVATHQVIEELSHPT